MKKKNVFQNHINLQIDSLISSNHIVSIKKMDGANYSISVVELVVVSKFPIDPSRATF